MIDIHIHIIPALDDGPPDMATSVGMGQIAAADGIDAIISTSHSEECSTVGRAGMEQRLNEVRAAWTAAGLNIRLELGMEIFLTPDTLPALKAGKLWPLGNSKYLLVELPYQPWPAYADSTLFDLQLAGYIPILAHPERYTAIQNNPNKMYELAERGILAQVTSGALLAEANSPVRKCAETLVRYNMAQFLSSDAHGVTIRKRLPVLTQALEVVTVLAGEETGQAMVETNPARVLEGKHVIAEPEPVEKGKSFFGRLFGG